MTLKYRPRLNSYLEMELCLHVYNIKQIISFWGAKRTRQSRRVAPGDGLPSYSEHAAPGTYSITAGQRTPQANCTPNSPPPSYECTMQAYDNRAFIHTEPTPPTQGTGLLLEYLNTLNAIYIPFLVYFIMQYFD